MKNLHDDLAGLYHEVLRHIYQNPEYSNSPRGRAEREIIGFQARLVHPERRFCLAPERRQNIVFNYAEVLWYLSGRNDLSLVEHYAPSMRQYSSDGRTLPGTGYGARFARKVNGEQTQLERLLEVLREDDPATKRAVLQIFDAGEDIRRCNIDVSCTLGLQFLLRDGKLNMVSFMRANDAYVGFLNDVFSFTFLQEFVARSLGVGLGYYVHCVGSMHIYDKDLQKVERLLSAGFIGQYGCSCPQIPLGAALDDICRLLEWERAIRCEGLSIAEIIKSDFESYWIEILKLFWIYCKIKDGSSVSADIVNGLHPIHRQLVINRWPEISA